MKLNPKQLDTSKNIVMRGGKLVLGSGTPAAPAIAFASNTNTGLLMYSSSLALSVGGEYALTVDPHGDLILYGSGATTLHTGNTAERPSVPQEGMIRYNTQLDVLECYANDAWQTVVSGAHDTAGGIIPLVTTTNNVGLVSGGDISDAGDLKVSVTAGWGYAARQVNGVDSIVRVSWPTTVLTLESSTSYLVFVTSGGVVTAALAALAPGTSVLLGRVSFDEDSVDFIEQTPARAPRMANLHERTLRRGIGPVYYNGSQVSESITAARTLDVTGGEYFYGSVSFTPTGGDSIQYHWYRHSGGLWTDSMQSVVDNAWYDNGTQLVAATAGYYFKHALFLVMDEDGDRYMLVHSQAQVASLVEAEAMPLPLPPDSFTDSVVLLASLIMKQGTNSIVEIFDNRPVVGFKSPTLSAAARHSNLLGLSSDDHKQYLLATGARAMTGDLNLANNNIVNVGTVNGVAVASHASRHLPNGADPLATASAGTLTLSSTNSTGSANSFARSDHTHAITGVQPLNADLTALAGLTGTGLLVRTAAGTAAVRSIVGTTGRISVSNGSAVSGNPTVDLATTGVTAGTFNTLTVDAYGRATTASNTAYLTGNQSITVSGDASGSGTTAIALTLATVNANVGTFNTLTVNAKGLVTAASNTAYLTGNQTITVSGDATGSGTTAIALTLASTGVTAGTYNNVTVNAKGLVTAASNVAVSAPVTSVAGRTGDVTLVSADITDAASANTASVLVRRDANGNFSAGTITAALSGNASSATTAGKLATARTISATGDATGSTTFDGSANSSLALTLAIVNTNTGTFNNITVNGKGLVTAASNVSYLTGNQTVTLSGDVSGSGSTAIATTLSNTAVTAGSYGTATAVGTFTVDSKGRLTAAGSTAIAFPVSSVAGRTGAVVLASADISDATAANTASRIVLRDASGNFAAGVITATLAGNASSATTAATAASAAKLSTARAIAHSGDATGSVSFDGSADVTVPLTLATVNSNTGAFGTSTSVGTFTVNGKGLITSATSTAIAFPVTSVAGRTGAITLASADITDATAANTASTVIKRDASGNFVAGTITASLSGNATSATTASSATTAGTASKLVTARAISVSGDATGSVSFDGSADSTIPLTLATVNANVGSFNRITVNGKGLVTAAVNRTITGSSGQIAVSNGDFSGDPLLSLAPNVVFPGTEGITVPNGTTAQRATTPQAGETRYNTDTSSLEVYQAGNWVAMATGSSATRTFYFYADQLDNPTSADWSVNALAPASNDATNTALVVRAFDDSTEEGVGFMLTIPTGVTNMTLRMRARASATATATRGSVMRLHRRSLAVNTAVTAWSITTLNTLTFPTTVLYQQFSQTLTLSSLSLTAGNLVQFELTRQGAATADTLVGDMLLIEMIVEFT